MATKKKVAPKAAAKKPVSAKKAAPKKAVKPVAKKAAPVSPAKKAAKPVASKPVTKKTAHAPVKPAQKVEKKVEKQPVVAKHTPAVSKKPEVKKTQPLKPLVKKPEPVQAPEPPKQVVTPPPFKQPVKKEEPVKPTRVVMPEIKTKTIRKYEPDFTKSVLDTPMQDNSGPTQRYSDSDLAEFRELINKKLDAAKKELNYLQGLITRKDEMGGDESDNRYMTMEDGSISMEREQLSQMASRQITFIDHLEKAIMRIENKTYGICRVTGKLIDKARLRAVPHATLSIEAKQTMNK
jgi:RNA polymerase-binding transcription factor DksA